MIEAYVFKAKEDVFSRKGTFYEGRSYFGRLSKTGKSLVMRSEEGYWIPVLRFELGFGWNFACKHPQFEKKATIYMRNRKRIEEFKNVEEYVKDVSNYHKYFYASLFKDAKLYS